MADGGWGDAISGVLSTLGSLGNSTLQGIGNMVLPPQVMQSFSPPSIPVTPDLASIGAAGTGFSPATFQGATAGPVGGAPPPPTTSTGTAMPGTGGGGSGMGLWTPQGGFNWALLKQAFDAWQTAQRLGIAQTMMDPHKIMAEAMKYNVLPAGLKTSIGLQTDAAAQQRGLGGAPGLWREMYSQALAPYEYQREQQAIQDEMAALEQASYAYGGTDPTAGLGALLTQLQATGGAH